MAESNGLVIIGCAVGCALLAGLATYGLEKSLNKDAATPIVPVAERTVSEANDSSRSSSPPVNSRQIAIPKSRDGHFWLDASINQKAVKFLVDTGASAVALTLADAQRLGFDVNGLDYNRRVITAAGEIKAASVTLAYVEIGGSRINNVEALIIREGLDNSLLGMSYLGRLTKLEATRTSLVLHP
jgi:aspartyl protease family protein